MLMFSNMVRILTSPYVTVVPADCSIYMKCCFIKNTVSVELGLKQTAFLNHDLCILPYGAIEACKYTQSFMQNTVIS
jgi:hypothetical protein